MILEMANRKRKRTERFERKDKLANYLLNIERGYVATNPFHNAVHATDVMFTTMYFYKAPLLRDITGALDKFSAVLAAVLHDFAHPGLSNPFLIATRAETAVMYNDQVRTSYLPFLLLNAP